MQVETCHGRLIGQGQFPCVFQVGHLQCHLDEGIRTHLDIAQYSQFVLTTPGQLDVAHTECRTLKEKKKMSQQIS